MTASGYEPNVTMVVPAFNEEDLIEEKILNSLSLDYPRDKLEVIVVNDGSTDNTGEIISRYAKSGIVVRENAVPMGKIGVMNTTVPEALGEVVVFSDVSAMLDKDAMASLVTHFDRDDVGCVSGRYVYDNEPRTSTDSYGGEGLYWKYEAFIREKESNLGNVIGSHGALYGIRKDLFSPLNTQTINDDLVLPLMAIEKQYKTVYEGKSVARERCGSDIENEFSRRVRIMRGNCRQVFDFRRLLNPSRGIVSFQFMSHKLLRVLSPIFVIGLLLSSIFCSHPFYRFMLWGQGIFYLMALLGSLQQRGEWRFRLFSLPYYFVFIQCAAALGVLQFLFSSKDVRWSTLSSS
jgi:cellulose synthase/poly-beta-1,6-N-acetylglucosamine synthase-like glycosyltransferase